MPAVHQPRQLVWAATSAASEMLIAQTLSCSQPVQMNSTRKLVQQYVPPSVLQGLLNCVIRQLAVHHADKASPPVIACLLEILLHPSLSELRLSDLSYVGSVELEDLDTLENALIRLVPSMTSLTHLVLATNRNKVTFPSCSTQLLKMVGAHCPNLQLLDLNHNNRVTSEGLLQLYPSDTNPGCPKLEKIFVQDCSIEPEDVAMLIHFFPNLQLVGYKELGSSLQILKSQTRKFGRKRKRYQYCLKLTHVDNSLSRVQRCDGEVIDFVCETCPDLENLKVRVCDEDVGDFRKLEKLKHLEVRFYTGVHHVIGVSMLEYLRNFGHRLSSLAIYCNELHARHLQTIAESCKLLTKLYLHANYAVMDTPLQPESNNLVNLEVLSVRFGHDELMISPAASEVVMYLAGPAERLQELYLLLRSHGITHDFFHTLLNTNRLAKLKVLIADAPRRTLAAPMLALTVDTALMLLHKCPELHILGNLIAWDVTQKQLADLREVVRVCNYNLTIICSQSNRLNNKLL